MALQAADEANPLASASLVRVKRDLFHRLQSTLQQTSLIETAISSCTSCDKRGLRQKMSGKRFASIKIKKYAFKVLQNCLTYLMYVVFSLHLTT